MHGSRLLRTSEFVYALGHAPSLHGVMQSSQGQIRGIKYAPCCIRGSGLWLLILAVYFIMIQNCARLFCFIPVPDAWIHQLLLLFLAVYFIVSQSCAKHFCLVLATASCLQVHALVR